MNSYGIYIQTNKEKKISGHNPTYIPTQRTKHSALLNIKRQSKNKFTFKITTWIRAWKKQSPKSRHFHSCLRAQVLKKLTSLICRKNERHSCKHHWNRAIPDRANKSQSNWLWVILQVRWSSWCHSEEYSQETSQTDNSSAINESSGEQSQVIFRRKFFRESSSKIQPSDNFAAEPTSQFSEHSQSKPKLKKNKNF